MGYVLSQDQFCASTCTLGCSGIVVSARNSVISFEARFFSVSNGLVVYGLCEVVLMMCMMNGRHIKGDFSSENNGKPERVKSRVGHFCSLLLVQVLTLISRSSTNTPSHSHTSTSRHFDTNLQAGYQISTRTGTNLSAKAL